MPHAAILSGTVAEPLSASAFAAFGDVAERPVRERRRYLPTGEGRTEEASIFSCWISSAARLGALPLRITTMERHPYSAQTFIPLGTSQYLAIVCSAGPDHLPDIATLRCFIAEPHQSVTFARNTWHHPMTVLGQAMEFVVAMGTTGRQDDDVFMAVDTEVYVNPPSDVERSHR
jgi:ureidoglycolate lyase